MLRSVVGFEKVFGTSFKDAALAKFVSAIERATGLELVADIRTLPFEDASLNDLVPLVRHLQDAGVLQNLRPVIRQYVDEPPLFSWSAIYEKNGSSGGSSVSSNRQALIATVAECLERRLWKYETDHFQSPITSSEALLHYPHIPLVRFAGFSNEQRERDPHLRLTPTSEFIWVRGRSLISNIDIYLPAQTVSGRMRDSGTHEPLIRPIITTGLATGQTKEGALLNGTLEVIERDAFMIMWLNQLTLPRLDLDELAAHDADLRELLVRIWRYRLEVDVVALVTDAPVHAVCAVIRDTTGKGPSLILGLSCEQSLAAAAAHAIAEGLRIRASARYQVERGADPETIVPKDIMHEGHMLYWLLPERTKRLDFLTAGPIQRIQTAAWESDSPSEYLARIVSWCRDRGYECVSVDIGRSKKNPTHLKVEMVVIPELQPMHLTEKYPSIFGQRVIEIPRRFGYTPRATPFTEEPHPFV